MEDTAPNGNPACPLMAADCPRTDCAFQVQNVWVEPATGEIPAKSVYAYVCLTCRGAWPGYGQFVFDVDVSITDVAVYRRAPCVIEVVALTGRQTATPELNAKIRSALHPETVRPQGDDLHICTATGVAFDIQVSVLTTRNFDLVRPEIEAKVTAAFLAFQRPAELPESDTQFAPNVGLLGARVSPSPLHGAAISVDGVIDVDVTGINYADLPWYEYPVLANLTVTQRGLDDG